MTINDLTMKVQQELTQETHFEIGDTIYLIADGNDLRLDTQKQNNISSIELLFISINYSLEELKHLIVNAIYNAELAM